MNLKAGVHQNYLGYAASYPIIQTYQIAISKIRLSCGFVSRLLAFLLIESVICQVSPWNAILNRSFNRNGLVFLVVLLSQSLVMFDLLFVFFRQFSNLVQPIWVVLLVRNTAAPVLLVKLVIRHGLQDMRLEIAGEWSDGKWSLLFHHLIDRRFHFFVKGGKVSFCVQVVFASHRISWIVDSLGHLLTIHV